MFPNANPCRAERIRDLQARLKTVAAGTERVRLLSEIAVDLASTDARKALEFAEDALRSARALGDTDGEAHSHRSVASAQYWCGEYDLALDHAEQALAQFTTAGEACGAARTYLTLSAIHQRRCRFADALAATLTALELSEGANDVSGIARAHHALGMLYGENKQLDKALEHRLEAARIREEIGERYELSSDLINIGNIHLRRGDLDLALTYYERSVEILRHEQPAGSGIATAYRNMGDVYLRRGDRERARSLYEQALESACALGLPKEEHRACLSLSRVAEAQRDLQAAIAFERRASELRERILNEDAAARIADMQAKYDAERSEREAELYRLRYVELEREVARRKEEVARRKEAEHNLAQARKLESLGLMAGGIAHDFNNLLQCVIGYTEIVRGQLGPEHEACGAVDRIAQAGSQAADLARQMLTYAGRQRYSLLPCNINEILAADYDLLRTSAGSATELSLSLAEDLPMVSAEASQVHRIVANLVHNAVEAHASTVLITTAARAIDSEDRAYWAHTGVELVPGPYVSLRLADNGDGMAADVLARVFDPFYSTKMVGRGLGLTAALGVIRGHKGGVAVTSEVGRGTTFDFVFPEAPVE